MLIRKKTGQSTAEYAIVIGLVIAAAVGMQIFVKRNLQGKIRDATDYNVTAEKDSSGEMFGVNPPTLKQYEPQDSYTEGEGMIIKRDAEVKVKTSKGGGVVREQIGQDVSERSGTQVIAASDNQ